MAKQTVFERAARGAENGSAAECTRILGELAALEQSERSARESAAPPSTELAYATSGACYQRPVDAGSRYREASLAGDVDAIKRLEAEHHLLTVRRDEIERLRV